MVLRFECVWSFGLARSLLYELYLNKQPGIFRSLALLTGIHPALRAGDSPPEFPTVSSGFPLPTLAFMNACCATKASLKTPGSLFYKLSGFLTLCLSACVPFPERSEGECIIGLEN